jgi:hypothetical protein
MDYKLLGSKESQDSIDDATTQNADIVITGQHKEDILYVSQVLSDMGYHIRIWKREYRKVG